MRQFLRVEIPDNKNEGKLATILVADIERFTSETDMDVRTLGVKLNSEQAQYLAGALLETL